MIEQPTGVPRRPARPRRVTIALGPSTHDGQSLRALARLAREGAAELTGLFVEDDDLLRIASLPFAVEVCRATSVRRRVELAEVERQLRTQAAAAERDGAAARWPQAENRVRPEQVAAQTGYMQGAAGIGRMFLELRAARDGRALSGLPDRVIAPGG